MFRFTICVVAFACLTATVYAGYAPALRAIPYGASVAAPAPIAVQAALPENTQARAGALTDSAGAQASAARLNNVNQESLDQYGHEIGVPLLVRNQGPLTNLYAASLPPRSFVGRVDPVFVKGPYGKIQHISSSSIGVAAV